METDKRIESILKDIPLKTRFEVLLEMEYIVLIAEMHALITDKERDDAVRWAKKVTKWLLREIKELNAR